MPRNDDAVLLKTAAATLRSQQAKIAQLESKALAREEAVQKVAMALEIVDLLTEKGEVNKLPVVEKVAALLESGRDLQSLRDTLRNVVPDMTFASLTKRDSSQGSSEDRVTQVITG